MTVRHTIKTISKLSYTTKNYRDLYYLKENDSKINSTITRMS